MEPEVAVVLFIIIFIPAYFYSVKKSKPIVETSRMFSKRGLTGEYVARAILEANGIDNIKVGYAIKLSDEGSHYARVRKTILLNYFLRDETSIYGVATGAFLASEVIKTGGKEGFLSGRNKDASRKNMICEFALSELLRLDFIDESEIDSIKLAFKFAGKEDRSSTGYLRKSKKVNDKARQSSL